VVPRPARQDPPRGQQSDFSGLAIDGGDARDNFFGEFFGSWRPELHGSLEAVEEFQVVTNGFAPSSAAPRAACSTS
jgi:hypothetical protein